MARDAAGENARLRAELEREKREHERALREQDKDRRALLSLLEEMDEHRNQIERARREWTAAFDAVRDPILLHDRDLRVVRANRAYAEAAGMAIGELIGKHYWEAFPRRDGPLSVCARPDGIAESGAEEEVAVGARVFMSRAYPVRDVDGKTTLVLHIFEDVTEQRRSAGALKARTHELGERVKELRTLYAIAHLSERKDLALQDLFVGVAELLPGAYQFPDIAGARIEFEGRTYASPRFTECAARQSAEIRLDGRTTGVVEVYYREPRPPAFEGPFLEEEGDLLETVAGRLGEAVATRRAAEELATAHELLERMFSGIHVLIAYLDRHFNFIRVNRAYAEADGRTPDFFPGKNHFALYPGPDTEAIFRRVVETGEPYVASERPFVYAEHPERGVSYWDWRLEPVRDVGGKVEGLIFTLLDVTERMRTREALAENEEKFRAISATAQDAIIMLDEAGAIVYWNPAAERIFGYGADEVRGKRMHDLFAPSRYRDAYESGMAAFRDTGEGPVVGKTLELDALRRDGTEFPVELSVSALKLKGRWHAVGILRDITERKRADAELRRGEAGLAEAQRIAHLGSWDWDATTDTITWSEECYRIFDLDPTRRPPGYADHLKLYTPESAARLDAAVKRSMQTGEAYELDLERAGTKEPRRVRARGEAKRDARGVVAGLRGTAQDVTARWEAEEKLRLSNTVVENSPTVLFRWKAAEGWPVEFVSANVERQFGYTPDELISGRVLFATIVHPDDLERVGREVASESAAGATHFAQEYRLVTRDHRVRWVDDRTSVIRDSAGNITHYQGVVIDQTARKEAEEALRRSEAGLAEAQRIAHLGSWELDLVTNKLTWSDEIFRIFEVDPERFGASYEAFLALVHPDDREAVDGAYTEHVKNHRPYDIVHRLLFSDGRIKYVHEQCETAYADGRALRSRGTVQDVTEHRLGEIALSRVARALRTLSAGNEVLVRASDEDALLRDTCRVIVEFGGYRMAWVGYAGEDAQKTVRPLAQSGFEEGYLESAPVSWADTVPGRGPTGTAIRTRSAQLARDVGTDERYAPWRESAVRHGYKAVLALPLCLQDGTCIGALTIYAMEANAFDEEEIRLLEELATDLSYGIVNLRLRREQARSADQLRESLTATIRAISLTVEKRDPYTAGHQNRVAELCVAIGRELGLDPDRLEGLRLGAMIHDIGKITVPAEILNRPGRLTQAEFEIIKSHPQIGYDIVKDVSFPWPVADMIVQHHERLDGSGYPGGLKGEEIITEARILAVADVVEAITAHRPYRPARGLEAAVAEIEAGRGSRYDAAAGDVCLRLIRERRFSFGGAPSAPV